jgi:hypothetical protein
MPDLRALIQRADRGFVQRVWDGWFGPRDEPARGAMDGGPARTSGGGRFAARGAYLMVGALVVTATLVDALSKADEIPFRLGARGNLWEPLLWNCTSGVIILTLLPLARHAAGLARGGRGRPWRVGLALVGLALAFAGVHVALMFPLRQLAYWVAGWDYAIRWSFERVFYELRKDLFTFAVLAVVFWLAERPAAATATAPDDGLPPTDPDAASELWLRDGRTSVLVDPREIVSVASAGNYVEYVLTGGRRHLIRATLQAEEARLARFGLARVHRTRLINLKRVVALEWRPSGDFELKLDTGDVVAGSRRFKAAVASLGA